MQYRIKITIQKKTVELYPLDFAKELEEIIDKNAINFDKLGISGFGFRRFLKNGKTIGYCSSNPNWNRFSKENPDIALSVIKTHYIYEISDIIKKSKQFCIRISDSNPNAGYAYVMHQVGISNNLVVYNTSSDYVDGYFFISTTNSAETISNYINNLNYIQDIVASIANQINDICIKKKYEGYYTTLLSPEVIKLFDLLKKTKLKIKSTSLKLNKDGKQYSFSKREIESLTLLSSNYTIKEIAELLDVSPKTISSYLSALKIKLKATSNKELIEFAQQICLTSLLEK